MTNRVRYTIVVTWVLRAQHSSFHVVLFVLGHLHFLCLSWIFPACLTIAAEYCNFTAELWHTFLLMRGDHLCLWLLTTDYSSSWQWVWLSAVVAWEWCQHLSKWSCLREAPHTTWHSSEVDLWVLNFFTEGTNCCLALVFSVKISCEMHSKIYSLMKLYQIQIDNIKPSYCM